MSGASAQLALQPDNGTLSKGRSPLAHLLHALNQPLTGLQCSLELAAARPQPTEHYVRTLREGLELTQRMRILVEAIRELVDAQPPDSQEVEPFRFDELLHSTVEDLLPVAESNQVRLGLVNPGPLPVQADLRSLAPLLFRFLESALSLAAKETELGIAAASEPGHVCLAVSWDPGPPPEHSPFSRQELGLMIAQAGWERAGAQWTHIQAGMTQTCTVRLPLASPLPHPNRADPEI